MALPRSKASLLRKVTPAVNRLRSVARKPALYHAVASDDAEAPIKSLPAAGEVPGALCAYGEFQRSSGTSEHRFTQAEIGQHWLRGVSTRAWGIAVGGGLRSEQCFTLAQQITERTIFSIKMSSLLDTAGSPIRQSANETSLSDALQNISEETAVATVHEAFNQGINYFDTSPFYGDGLSEIVSLADYACSCKMPADCLTLHPYNYVPALPTRLISHLRTPGFFCASCMQGFVTQPGLTGELRI